MDRKIIQWAIVAFLSVSIVLSLSICTFRQSLYEKDFYSYQYEKNQVYQQLPKEIVDAETDNILNYFKSDSRLLDSYTFNQKEIEHMADVKRLVDKVNDMFIVSIAGAFILVVALFFYDETQKKNFSKGIAVSFMASGLILILFVLSVFVLSLNFGDSWTKFHELSFDNDKWMLDPNEDKLIVMFPEAFFQSFVAWMMAILAVKALIILFAGKYIQGLSNKTFDN